MVTRALPRSDGQEWKDLRVLHHKQIRPANVRGYSSGINRATDRLLKALEASRNNEQYVDDIYPHVMNWAMEGIKITVNVLHNALYYF